MQRKLFDFDIDFKKRLYHNINPKQGETGATLFINLYDEGVPYELDNVSSLQVMFKRPDGFLSYIPASHISDNTIKVDLTNQVLNKDGLVKAEVILEDNFSVKSQTFEMNVEYSVGHTELKSTNELGAIDQLVENASSEVIEKIEKLKNDVNEWHSESESKENERRESESDRVSNESTRQSNESTRQSNESTRESNESTRKSNESTRESNESTRESNENSRISNEEERQANEASRQESIEEFDAQLAQTVQLIESITIEEGDEWNE